MNNQKNIQKALDDIAIIKQTLKEKKQENVDYQLNGITLSVNVIIQGGAFVFALLLLIYELISNGTMSTVMMIEGTVAELRNFAIGFVGFTLVGLLVPLYFILWRAAKHNGEDMNAYIVRNFIYIKNLSLVSDLLMKFIALSLAILAGKPEWIAPLLAAFTGDYLLQNRFFTLPTKLSSILGIICIAIGFWLFFANIYTLYIPLLIFTTVAGISVIRLFYRYKVIQSAINEEE